MEIKIEGITDIVESWTDSEKMPLFPRQVDDDSVVCLIEPDRSGSNYEAQYIQFLVAGEKRWLISNEMFSNRKDESNTSKIVINDRNRGNIYLKFTLTNARFPGTNVIANLVCTIFQSNNGEVTDMNLIFNEFGGFEYNVSFLDWLNNNQIASSTKHISKNMDDIPGDNHNFTLCHLGKYRKDTLRVNIEDQSLILAEFYPNWLFILKTKDRPFKINIAYQYDGKDPERFIESESIRLRLLDILESSLKLGPLYRKRSLVTVERGKKTWSNKVAYPTELRFTANKEDVTSLVFARIDTDGESFEKMYLELGDDGKFERNMLGMCYVSSYEESKIRIFFNPDILNRDSNLSNQSRQTELSLVNVTNVINYVDNETYLIANLKSCGKWLFINNHAFQIQQESNEQWLKVYTKEDDLCMSVRLFFDYSIVSLPYDVVSQPRIIDPSDFHLLKILGKSSDSIGSEILDRQIAKGIHLFFPFTPLTLTRYKDLLNMDLLLVNASIESELGQIPNIVKQDVSQDTVLFVSINSPQHIAEGVISSQSEELDSDPIRSYSAGPTLLIFKIPDSLMTDTFKPLKLTIDTLLKWENYIAVLDPRIETLRNANQDSFPRALENIDNITKIEAPWKLYISPTKTGGWKHTINAISDSKYIELWHTRLGVKKSISDTEYEVDENDPIERKIFVIGNETVTVPEEEFTTSLSNGNRTDISVKSMTDNDGAVHVDKLYLSSLGSWLEVSKTWSSGLTWVHKANMGRDNYVNVTYRGIICYTGHSAIYTKITERKFIDTPNGNIAYLEQRHYVQFEQRTQYYNTKDRSLVYSSIEIYGDMIYEIDNPGSKTVFYITRNNKEIPIPLIGTDSLGKRIKFEGNLIFVQLGDLNPADENYPEQCVERINDGITENNLEANFSKRTSKLHGQEVNYINSNSGYEPRKEDSLPTFSMTFCCKLVPGEDLKVQPTLNDKKGTAQVIIPSLDNFTGKPSEQFISDSEVKSINIKFYQGYLDKSLLDSIGQIYIQLLEPFNYKFSNNSADKAGGLASPNLSVYGLSRKFGPVNINSVGTESDVEQALSTFNEGTFDPSSYFDLESKLFGYFDIREIIEVSRSKFDIETPKLTVIKDLNGLDNIIEYFWRPKLKDYTIGPIQFMVSKTESNRYLTLHITIDKSDPLKPKVTAEGTINDFELKFLEYVTIAIGGLIFTKESGKKMKVSVNEIEFSFKEELKILDTLKNSLPKILDKNTTIDVTKDGVEARYTLPIPDVQLGAINVANILLEAALYLPFGNKPLKFGFSFGKREDPFLVTVSVYGGGGFFGFVSGRDGIELLQAALEFGGHCGMDKGPASGSITVMAGIYLQIEKSEISSLIKNIITVTGYLRASGNLDVAGLVTVTVEFFMGLTYTEGNNYVEGSVTVGIRVKVFLAKKTFKLRLYRKFYIGSDGSIISHTSTSSENRLTFKKMMSKRQWTDEYRKSFIKTRHDS